MMKWWESLKIECKNLLNGIAAKPQNKKQTKGPGVSPTLRLNEGLFIHDIPARKKKSYMQLKFSVPQKAVRETLISGHRKRNLYIFTIKCCQIRRKWH